MNSQEIMKYSYVAELNYEAFLMTQSFVLDQFVRNNMILISLEEENENEETSEWVGFVKTMKIFIKKNLGYTTDRLEGEIKGLEGKINGLDNKMETLQAKVEQDMLNIGRVLNKLENSNQAIMTKLQDKPEA